jgi:hypothetical protein
MGDTKREPSQFFYFKSLHLNPPGSKSPSSPLPPPQKKEKMKIFLEKKTFLPLQVLASDGKPNLSQPYFEKDVRMKLTFPKWELGSPPGLLKLQNSIAGSKTPCIGALFISLESYRSVDVKNGLA